MSAVRALTILNQTGDQTVVWGEEDDDQMEKVIAKMMERGVTFFIVEPRAWGLLSPKKTALAAASEARKHRALSIKDGDLSAFVLGGGGEVMSTPTMPTKTVRRGKTAKEIATSESVAVQPRRGG